VRAVSRENIEMVRHIYESGLIDRDPEELLKLATPDVEYINPPYAVEPGVRRGLGAVAQAMRRFAEVVDALCRHGSSQGLVRPTL
jgi:ketosteroid isomerase-like protein